MSLLQDIAQIKLDVVYTKNVTPKKKEGWPWVDTSHLVLLTLLLQITHTFKILAEPPIYTCCDSVYYVNTEDSLYNYDPMSSRQIYVLPWPVKVCSMYLKLLYIVEQASQHIYSKHGPQASISFFDLYLKLASASIVRSLRCFYALYTVPELF